MSLSIFLPAPAVTQTDPEYQGHPRDTTLVGVGVDLISRRRVKRFLAEHSFDFLKRLLTVSEQAVFKNGPSPVRFFARSFAAKEAYFKALEGEGMGEEMFRRIEIQEKGEGRFLIRSLDAPRGSRNEGRFFDVSDGVGAQVFIWKEKNQK